jgi:hypothetical protein
MISFFQIKFYYFLLEDVGKSETSQTPSFPDKCFKLLGKLKLPPFSQEYAPFFLKDHVSILHNLTVHVQYSYWKNFNWKRKIETATFFTRILHSFFFFKDHRSMIEQYNSFFII